MKPIKRISRLALAVSALSLVREGETMLFDCGEGTQRQMMRYGVSFGFREIFFTHFHSDHMLGVIGLLRTLGLLNIFGEGEEARSDGLILYGPRGAQRAPGARSGPGVGRGRTGLGDASRLVAVPARGRADR